MSKPLPQGARIGILGGGQLGRMLSVAASRLGFLTHIYEPGANPPAAQVADECTMASYEDRPDVFPPKAGVYAVRSGPVISHNIAAYLNKDLESMQPYIPQTEFLALLMTGDGKAVGTKFGISFTGKWVWKLKDYIDVSFMNLFNKHYLYHDFDTKGYENPVQENSLYEEERGEILALTDPIKERMSQVSAPEAAQILAVEEDHEEYWEQWFVLVRMTEDPAFADEVVKHYSPEYQKF